MPVNRPHDKLFRAVFGHAPEAAALLRAHLPDTLARDLQWSSLTLQDATFVDDELRGSESDLLFSVERTAGDQPPVWLYVLLEHQSKPSRWMPFRLLKYCWVFRLSCGRGGHGRHRQGRGQDRRGESRWRCGTSAGCESRALRTSTSAPPR